MDDQERTEHIRVAAYYIAQKKHTYDQLVYMLAEKEQLLAEKQLLPESSDSSEDALKFFHNWITSMIDVGGPNLPKTISSSLGSKLGKIYKARGVTDFKDALKKSYKALQGESEVTQIDDDTVEVKTIYTRNFCPIGGKHNPKNADIFQTSICTPFTVSFLNEIDSSRKYIGDIKECILSTDKNKCHYLLHLEEKEK